MSHERQPYSNVKRVGNARCHQFDTHELLKQEVFKQGYDADTQFRFGLNAPAVLQGGAGTSGPSPQTVGFEDIELYFDSTQRDTSSDYTIGEIKWNVPIINNSTDIKNCVEMHLPTFFFPKIYAPTTAPEYFYYRRVLVEFQNAPSNQAVLGPNNNKFHFEFEVENITGQAVKLVPLKPSFFFQRPITSITDFQFRFMVPPTTSSPVTFKKIPIPHDTVSITSLTTGGFGYNPIRFQINGTDDTTVLGLVGSLGTPGVAVFITGYASNSSGVNTAVNATVGIYATTVLDATTFEISGINASAVTAQYSATMFIPKNRIAFPLRFTCVRDQNTNYIDVTHD